MYLNPTLSQKKKKKKKKKEKPNPYSAHSLKLSFCKYPFLNRSFSTVLTMAQPDLQNHSPEIKEPSLKIPKLGQNGVAAEISKDPISLLRVKKLSELPSATP